ncbi:hypothetical protein REPUB_Repub05bG0201600 [Reevesia pubescens]
MEEINNGDVNQETLNASLSMPSSNESGNGERALVIQSNQSITENQNQVPHGQPHRVGSNMDPKKLKRVAASREYSQRYRLKQLQYIAQLEAGVRALQTEVAITYPRIKYADTQNSLLRVENGSMKQKLYALSRELMLKQAEYQELKKEKDTLKQISLLCQAPFPEISQTKHYSYQLVNIAMDQPGFNQVMDATGVSKMPNQNLGNQFGSNRDNRNPM